MGRSISTVPPSPQRSASLHPPRGSASRSPHPTPLRAAGNCPVAPESCPDRIGTLSEPPRNAVRMPPEPCPANSGTLSDIRRNPVRIESESVSEQRRNTQRCLKSGNRFALAAECAQPRRSSGRRRVCAHSSHEQTPDRDREKRMVCRRLRLSGLRQRGDCQLGTRCPCHPQFGVT
jgi:hypothetical protein